MARNGVNKVILVGNLGQAPEIRYLPNGTAIATFSIATSESWKDRETDEMKEQTEWHKIVCYRKLAEIAEKFLTKGAKVYVEGRLRTRKWKDNAGNDRSSTDIQIDDLRILDSRRANAENPASLEFNEQVKHSQKAVSNVSKPAATPFADLENMEFDDDIPF